MINICPQLKTRLLFKTSFRRFSTNINSTTSFYIFCKRGASRLFVEIFLSHSTEKFCRGTLRFIRKFRVAKNFMHKKGISLNSVEKTLSHSADKIRRRTLLCFERILVSKIFKQRRGKLHGFVKKLFISQDRKKLLQGTILCHRKFLVGKNILWVRERGGGYHDFPSKSFCLTTEIFHWRTLWCFRKILFSKILMHRRGGGHHGFVEIFCLTGPKRKALYRNPSVFRKFSGIEKNLWIRGGISRFLVGIFMSHSAENFRKGILLFLIKFLASKSFMDEKGGITFFRRKFFVSQCRKTSWASLQCFRKFGVSKNYMHNRGDDVFRAKIFLSQCRKIS